MERELPEKFIKSLTEAVGAEHAASLVRSLTCDAPSLAVRVNIAKGAHLPDSAVTVPWEPRGFYIDERPVFAADPAWHQGRYYVQEASSMATGRLAAILSQQYLKDNLTINYLDACAAPGGKTIGAVDALGARGFVVANEADRHRAAVLAENLAKRGASNTAVLCGPAQRLGALSDTFDIIAADAPCSGEGMMRKEPEAIAQWSTTLVASCAALQREIVTSLWPALRPGGIFIYSTCTFNRHEDDDVVRHMLETLDAELIDIDAALFPGAVKCDYGLRFLPGIVRGEGLFMAALRKSEAESAVRSSKKGSAFPSPAPGMADFASRCISEPENFIVSGNRLIPKRHAETAAKIGTTKGLMRLGTPLGEVKGRDIVPSHELAMSTALRPDAFPTLELPYSSAMSYLRGEAIADIPDGLPKGIVTVTWQGRPLGFAKNIGRRANNLYPDAMRLRIQPRALPPQAPSIIK